VLAGALASACATSPSALPPPRVAFSKPRAAPLKRAPDLVRASEAPVVNERYSGWILAADGLSMLPLLNWIIRPEDIYLALPSLLAPPAIHLLHGESTNAAVSLLMRVAMLGGVYLAGRQGDDCADDCMPVLPLLLATISIVPVITIDSALLAHTTRPAEGWRNLPVHPTISRTADGKTWLFLGGRF